VSMHPLTLLALRNFSRKISSALATLDDEREAVEIDEIFRARAALMRAWDLTQTVLEKHEPTTFTYFHEEE
jgi:hypothetical protein